MTRTRAGISRTKQGVGQQLIGAGVDMDDIAGREPIGAQQGGQIGHGRIGRLARIQVVARRRRILAARSRRGGDIIIIAGIGDEEGLFGNGRHAIGRHSHDGGIAIGDEVGGPGDRTIAIGVDRRRIADEHPSPAIIGRNFDLRGFRRGRRRRLGDFDARQHCRIIGHIVEFDDDAAAARGGDIIGHGHRRIGLIAGRFIDIEIIRDDRAVDLDVEQAAALADIGIFREIQRDLIGSIADGDGLDQFLADAVTAPGGGLVNLFGRSARYIPHDDGLRRIILAIAG